MTLLEIDNARESLRKKYFPVEFMGNTYLPVREAYLAGTLEAPCYECYAIRVWDDPDEYDSVPLFKIFFEITNPEAEDESEACDWTEIFEAKEDGEYDLANDCIY